MNKRQIANHFKINSQLLSGFDGFVYSQAEESVGKSVFGRAEKTVKKVGCGAVAAYNAAKFLGIKITLPEVIRDFEELKIARLFGVLGSKPLGIKRFFKRRKISSKLFFNVDSFKAALPKCKIAVVCSFNEKLKNGMHFYCVRFDEESGTLKAMNHTYSPGETTLSPDKIRLGRFVAGYALK